MNRWLFTILSVLCVTTCAMWVRSYSAEDVIGYRDDGSPPRARAYYSVCSTSGWIVIDRSYPDPVLFIEPAAVKRRGFRWYRGAPESPWLLEQRFCVGWTVGAYPQLGCVGIRHWCIVVVTLLPVSLLGRRILRDTRRSHGHCRVCGYDLRATPDGCPECGTVPKKIQYSE